MHMPFGAQQYACPIQHNIEPPKRESRSYVAKVVLTCEMIGDSEPISRFKSGSTGDFVLLKLNRMPTAFGLCFSPSP